MILKQLQVLIVLLMLIGRALPVGADQFIPISVDESLQKEGFAFIVRKAVIDQWVMASQEHPFAEKNRPMLALTLDIKNNAKNKKVDLRQSINLLLLDEFNNSYEKLATPSNYHGAPFLKNKHYPSLYPGEVFTQVIFFEAPIASSKNLFLIITLPEAENTPEVQLKIARDKIHDVTIPPKWRRPVDKDLMIMQPVEASIIKPGDIVHIEIRISQDIKKPDSIFILTPIYVLEDKSLSCQYDIKIPEEQELGNFPIGVMASWKNSEQKITTISRSVTLQISDPTQDCIDDCYQNTPAL